MNNVFADRHDLMQSVLVFIVAVVVIGAISWGITELLYDDDGECEIYYFGRLWPLSNQPIRIRIDPLITIFVFFATFAICVWLGILK
ncbi:MAG: hypothetical protein V1768_00765 [Patescibacteria group bacterium]|nr:hypothetical protein [Patescibacteria group bacterium]